MSLEPAAESTPLRWSVTSDGERTYLVRSLAPDPRSHRAAPRSYPVDVLELAHLLGTAEEVGLEPLYVFRDPSPDVPGRGPCPGDIVTRADRLWNYLFLRDRVQRGQARVLPRELLDNLEGRPWGELFG